MPLPANVVEKIPVAYGLNVTLFSSEIRRSRMPGNEPRIFLSGKIKKRFTNAEIKKSSNKTGKEKRDETKQTRCKDVGSENESCYI